MPDRSADAGRAKVVERLRPKFAIASTILAGLIAPLRHPLGYLLCSLPWIAATIALNQDMLAGRTYTPFLGFCCEGWHYNTSIGLYLLQAVALSAFIISWIHLVHTERLLPRDTDFARLGPRAGHLILVLVVIGLLGILAIGLLFALGHAARSANSSWWWGDGRIQFKIAFGLILAWIASRLALYLPSAAAVDRPLVLADAWDRSRGQAFWIFVALVPGPLLIAMIKTALLSSLMGNAVETPLGLFLDVAPLWTHTPTIDPVPGWLFGTSILLAWLQISFVSATLALLHRRLY